MIHSHIWKRDNARTHRRSPRFFVKCQCGETAQAVMRHGYLHTFQTNKKINPNMVKKVRSVRLSDLEIDMIRRGKLHLTIVENRITIAA